MPSAEGAQRKDWLRNVFAGNGLYWLLYLIFIIVSMVTVSSAISSEYYKAQAHGSINPQLKHALMLLLGVFAAIFFARISAKNLRNLLPRLSLLAMFGLCVAIYALGRSTNGAERWIHFAGLTLQPAEFLRLFIVIWGAHITASDTTENPNKLRAYIGYAIFVGGFALAFASSNLSMLVIYAIFFVLYCWTLRAPKKFLRWLVILGIGGATLFTSYLLLAPESMLIGRSVTWRNRIHRMIEPKQPTDGATAKFDADERHQEEMGRMAVASAGRGPGKSKMRDHLPLAYSDYLYATIIEEYGIFGLLLIPGLYIAWMLLAYREARKQTNIYRSNLIKGFGILYPLQALVNMVVSSGLITTGQPLPLLSYGGSSVLASSIAIGITIAASRVDRPKRQKQATPCDNTPHPEEPEGVSSVDHPLSSDEAITSDEFRQEQPSALSQSSI